MTAWAFAWAWMALHVPPAPAPIHLSVPYVRDAFRADGMTEEAFWTRQASRTGAFVDDDGRPARPFAEGHFAWDESGLRVALYAADRDITRGDVFRLTFAVPGSAGGEKSFALEPTTRHALHAKVGVDLDGSWNDARGDDEEWVVEAAIPWVDLGIARPVPGATSGATIALTLERHDAAADTPQVSVSHWGTRSGRGQLVLAPRTPP